MITGINEYVHQNYAQRNLNANSPSFGAQIHKGVTKKATKYASEFSAEVQETMQKSIKNIVDSRSPHVLTGTFLGAYFLKNPITGAKVEVLKPSKKENISIVDTLKDADKKLFIMECLGTENNEVVQKVSKSGIWRQELGKGDRDLDLNPSWGFRNISSLKSLCFWSELAHKIALSAICNEYNDECFSDALKKMTKENKEIVLGLMNAAGKKDSYQGEAARRIISFVSPEQMKYAPEVMPLAKKMNREYAGDAVKKMTEENKEIVLGLMKAARKDSYQGEAARRIISFASPEQMKYAPEVMALVNKENCKYAGYAVKIMTEENKEIVLGLMKAGKKDSYQGEAARSILFSDSSPEQMKYAPEVMPLVNELNCKYAGDAVEKMTEENKEIVLGFMKAAGKKDSYQGEAARSILRSDFYPEQMKYAPEVMAFVNELNCEYAGAAVRLMTEEYKEIVLGLMKAGKKDSYQSKAARSIFYCTTLKQKKYAPEVMPLVNELNCEYAAGAVDKMTEENKEIVLGLMKAAGKKDSYQGEAAGRILYNYKIPPEQMKYAPEVMALVNKENCIYAEVAVKKMTEENKEIVLGLMKTAGKQYSYSGSEARSILCNYSPKEIMQYPEYRINIIRIRSMKTK